MTTMKYINISSELITTHVC